MISESFEQPGIMDSCAQCVIRKPSVKLYRMIISGRKASRLGSVDIPNSTCDYCEQGNTQQLTVFGKYAHIFWIPFFPIGRKAISECKHCKRTIEQKDFSPRLMEQYKFVKSSIKRPFWHWSGLGFIAIIFFYSAILRCGVEPDPRMELLLQDERQMTSSPTMQSDSLSFKLKQMFDAFINEELHPEDFEYFTRVDGNKALILVRVPKLKKVEKEPRGQLLEMIETVVNSQKDYKNKEHYIGVKGVVTMMLIKTPGFEDNSRVAEESKLYDFYGEKPKEKEK